MEQTGHMHKIINFIFGLICVLFVVISCCGCNKTYSEIEPELKNIMAEQYGVFLSDSVKLENAKFYTFAERDPHLDVVFVVDKNTLCEIFYEQMWNITDVESAINEDNDTETSVRWNTEFQNTEDAYYYAEMYILKKSSDLYQVNFCGFGVNTKYFK